MCVTGVLHIGAHFGEENKIYDMLEYPNRVFFEPLLKNFNVLSTNVSDKEHVLYNMALGAARGVKTMYVESANQGQSSSILKPKIHLKQYPHITFPEREKVSIDTLDNVIKNKLTYNFINMDVQGYELEVLKGAPQILKNIDYLMCEVNREEVYEKCCMVEEVDNFLQSYNLERVETNWAGHTWGDAFYVRK